MKIIILDFLHFLKNPHQFLNHEKEDKITSIKNIFALLVLKLLFVIIILAPLLVIFLDKIDAFGHILDNDNSLKTFISIVILAPIIEELIFRAYLKTKSYWLPICFLIFALIVTKLFLFDTNFYFFAYVITAFTILYQYNLKISKQNGYEESVKRFYPIFFYLSALAFAWVHLDNYKKLTTDDFLFYPILISSQFMGGLVLGYLRLRFGLIYSILCHALWNGMLFCLAFFLWINFIQINSVLDLS